jgi:hypothetical protein
LERRELTVLDQWTNFVSVGECPDFLIVILFVAEKNRNVIGIPFDERWCDLRIALSGRRHIQIEYRIHSRVDQQYHLQLLNRQFHPLRVVLQYLFSVLSITEIGVSEPLFPRY